jgi:hypothetical protein
VDEPIHTHPRHSFVFDFLAAATPDLNPGDSALVESLGLVISPVYRFASVYLSHTLLSLLPSPLMATEVGSVMSQTLGMQELFSERHYTLPMNSEHNEAPTI